MEACAQGGHVKTLRRISARQPADKHGQFSNRLWRYAGGYGHQDVVDFLLSVARRPLPVCAAAILIRNAVATGRLVLLQHLKDHADLKRLMMDGLCLTIALKNGHLAIAKWLHHQGCRGPQSICAGCQLMPQQLTVILLGLRHQGIPRELREVIAESILKSQLHDHAGQRGPTPYYEATPHRALRACARCPQCLL